MILPSTEDNINYYLEGCTVKFLGMDDVIMKGDFIRDLVEDGEEGGFNTTFKSPLWQGTAWHEVEKDLGGWIGNTYRDYLKFCNVPSGEMDMVHEICRTF